MKPLRKGGLVDGGVVVDLVADVVVGVAVVAVVELLVVQRRRRLLLPGVVMVVVEGWWGREQDVDARDVGLAS